jgi:lysophospholipase L1-like esterase
MTNSSKGGRVLVRLAALVAGTAVGVGLAEVGLRILSPQIFPVHPVGMYVLDPTVGYRLAPGFEGVIERAEFRHTFRVNDLGVRSSGSSAAPRARLRVLVLGDSQAFGFGVEDDETFAALLERRLSARRREGRVEVINAGVPGYGTADELAWLQAVGAELEPDLVIVQFLSTNDPIENRNPASTWATLSDGMLATRAGDEAEYRSFLSWLKRRSHLVHLVSNTVGYFAMRAGVLGEDDRVDGPAVSESDLDRTRDLLESIVRTARSLGADCVLVHSTGQAGILSEDYVEARAASTVRDAAARTGATWIDAARGLQAREDRNRMHYPRDGHWTAAGHRAVAELLEDTIAALLARDLPPLRTASDPGSILQRPED